MRAMDVRLIWVSYGSFSLFSSLQNIGNRRRKSIAMMYSMPLVRLMNSCSVLGSFILGLLVKRARQDTIAETMSKGGSILRTGDEPRRHARRRRRRLIRVVGGKGRVTTGASVGLACSCRGSGFVNEKTDLIPCGVCLRQRLARTTFETTTAFHCPGSRPTHSRHRHLPTGRRPPGNRMFRHSHTPQVPYCPARLLHVAWRLLCIF